MSGFRSDNPLPKGFRTADFIFERKGVYKMFDLKTIFGSNSVDNRLSESVHQTNCVLLHMATCTVEKVYQMLTCLPQVVLIPSTTCSAAFHEVWR